MTNEIAPMQQFQERVLEKLKADIGSLLPEEAMKSLIDRAVDESFFKNRETKDSYGKIVSSHPSWFVQEVAKIMKPKMEEAAKQFIEENREKLEEAFIKFSSDQNLLLLTMGAMQAQFSNNIYELAGQVAQRIKNGY